MIRELAANPSLLQDIYPDFIDPDSNDDTDTYNALLLNPAEGGHDENVWFSVPQKVRNGFTSYFSFKLTPGASTTADGIAFVVQNAQGGGTPDPDSTSQEQGSGLTCGAVVAAVSAIPGLITVWQLNSIPTPTMHRRLKRIQTLPHLTTPVYYDGGPSNHIAIQSCGTGVNSSSHGPNGCCAAP